MEKLSIFDSEHFILEPNREEVFGWLSCEEQLPCYDVFSTAWEEAVSMLPLCTEPRAALLQDEDSATLFITLGIDAEKQITQLFQEQRYVVATILNTLCDEMLFQMDRQVVASLESLLGTSGHHISAWLEPIVDLPAEELERRFKPLLGLFPYVRISHQGTLFPTKSMMYCVSLTRDGCQQNALHDCSRCSQPSCPYRRS